MLEKVTWATLLAPNNLPEVVKRCEATYLICTAKRDQEKIRAMPAFKKIAAMMPVEFSDTPSESPDPMFHMDWFRISAGIAKARNAIYWNIFSDVVYSQNAFGNAAKAIEAGMAGCVIPTVRVISETCIPDVMDNYTVEPGEPLVLSGGETVRLATRHMHAITATSAFNSVHSRPNSWMVYRVPDEGMIARSASTWFFVDPSRIQMHWYAKMTENDPVYLDDDDPASQIHVPASSDEMFFLSLAEMGQLVGTFIPDFPNVAFDVARVTRNANRANSPFDDCFDKVCTVLPYATMDPEKWAPVEQQSETAFRRIRSLRGLYRVWEQLRNSPHSRSAGILALAIISTKLAARWPTEHPVTAFIPSNAALDKMPEGLLDDLLAWPARRRLVHRILGLTVADAPELSAVESCNLTTLAGTTVHLEKTGDAHRLNRTANIVDTIRSGPHTIHFLDNWPEPDMVSATVQG